MCHPGAPLSLADRCGGPSSICRCLSLLWGLVHVCSCPLRMQGPQGRVSARSLQLSSAELSWQRSGLQGRTPTPGFRCLFQLLPSLVILETYTTSEHPMCSVLVCTSSGHPLVGLPRPPSEPVQGTTRRGAGALSAQQTPTVLVSVGKQLLTLFRNPWSTDPSRREHLAAPNPSAVVSVHLPPAPELPSSPKDTRDPVGLQTFLGAESRWWCY